MVLHHHDRHDFGVSHAYNIHQYTIYIYYIYIHQHLVHLPHLRACSSATHFWGNAEDGEDGRVESETAPSLSPKWHHRDSSLSLLKRHSTSSRWVKHLARFPRTRFKPPRPPPTQMIKKLPTVKKHRLANPFSPLF